MKIYVAAPYNVDSIQGQYANVERAMDAGIELIRAGYYPFVPHLSHFLDTRHGVQFGERLPASVWYDQDNQWLRVCDALVFLDHSYGVDMEIALAKELSIPVYDGLDAFFAAHPVLVGWMGL